MTKKKSREKANTIVSRVWICRHVLTFNLLNFLNGIIHLSFLELSIIIFREIKKRTWSCSIVSQQYRAWSDCTDMQDGLTLYWWQRLITSSASLKSLQHISISLKVWRGKAQIQEYFQLMQCLAIIFTFLLFIYCQPYFLLQEIIVSRHTRTGGLLTRRGSHKIQQICSNSILTQWQAWKRSEYIEERERETGIITSPILCDKAQYDVTVCSLRHMSHA